MLHSDVRTHLMLELDQLPVKQWLVGKAKTFVVFLIYMLPILHIFHVQSSIVVKQNKQTNSHAEKRQQSLSLGFVQKSMSYLEISCSKLWDDVH